MVAELPARLHSGTTASLLASGALALAVFGLVGRLLSYPLNRDENLFVSVASELGTGDLYRDLGYNHLPNLAYLLGGIFALIGDAHHLLIGRLVIVVSWLLALLALWLVSRRLEQTPLTFFAAAFLLVGNFLLLGEPGMLVSNNFLPIPCVFFAFSLLLGGIGNGRRSSFEAFLAGLLVSITIGLKANYIILAPAFFFATLLAPAATPLADRLRTASIPLALGGLLGGLPALAHFAYDPDGFLAHTLRYFTELQTAYWQSADEPKNVALAKKVLLAEKVWFAGTNILAIFAICLLGTFGTARERRGFLKDWRIVLLAALSASGFVIAFLPTPSFAQYFVPPIPFLILLFMVLAARLERSGPTFVRALSITLCALGLLVALPRLGSGAIQFASADDWETLKIGSEIARLGDRAGLEEGALVATLTPVMALEAGYSIYPEFTAGQFVYRVAPFIMEEDREYYRTTSPGSLHSFLDDNPPDAILINRAEPMEAQLAAYALARGYKAYSTSGIANGVDLFVARE